MTIMIFELLISNKNKNTAGNTVFTPASQLRLDSCRFVSGVSLGLALGAECTCDGLADAERLECNVDGSKSVDVGHEQERPVRRVVRLHPGNKHQNLENHCTHGVDIVGLARMNTRHWVWRAARISSAVYH